MSNKHSTKDWFHFIDEEIKGNKTRRALKEYVSALYKNDVPVIFEYEHLSKMLGFSLSTLTKIIMSPESFYYNFQIPKRRGE